MKAKLVNKLDLTGSITSFYFEPELDQPLRYTAGQFIEMTLQHDSDDRGTKRWFTLSSAPGNKQVTITSKHAAPDVRSSSFKTALWNLIPGTEVDISEPMGDFVLPKDSTTPLVFVAGGIGITPFHSIVEWLENNQQQRSIQLLYSVKTREEVVFSDLFDKSYIQLQTLVGQPNLTAEQIIEKVGGVDGKQVYISGPEPMTEAIVEQFGKLGIGQDQLITDYFPGYAA